MTTIGFERLVRLVAVAAMLGAFWPLSAAHAAEKAEKAAASENSCVACHSEKKWLVQNKKIYDYWENWSISVHNEEGVTCTDCHGGNSKAKDKATAHAGRSSSAINFKNIPKTCSTCHSKIYEAYEKSAHAAHLSGKLRLQGPSCVTCHGSVNAAIISSGTVAQVCSTCHNDKTKNHPEIPQRAAYILTRFLSIQRLYRYVTLKGDPEAIKGFVQSVDPIRGDLAYEWHTFDLDKVEGKTRLLLDSLKKQRDEVRAHLKNK